MYDKFEIIVRANKKRHISDSCAKIIYRALKLVMKFQNNIYLFVNYNIIFKS